MLFNSYEFIFVFLPVSVTFYFWLSRYSKRLGFLSLVVSSLFFYGWWKVEYLFLIIASITVNYIIGQQLTRKKSRMLLTIGVIFNLSIIAYYKYMVFFADIFSEKPGSNFTLTSIVIPLGISFYTFQQIAYLVDCNQRKTVKHDFLDYSLFVTFFPQLIAGPIVHQKEILPQLRERQGHLNTKGIAIGLSVFVLGLAKKVLIADTISGYATPVFDASHAGDQITFLAAWGGSLAYTFQLYFDFSGYSDMALGLGLIFGISLPLNFNSPYKARSIIDFWRRWHMTLSRFLRDYLYYPLGGNRHGPSRRYVNVMIVMILGGFWHGANWTFVAWGLLHGIFILINHGWRAIPKPIVLEFPGAKFFADFLSWALTFFAVVIGWVFFRSEDFQSALSILSSMAGMNGGVLLPYRLENLLSPFELSFIHFGIVGPEQYFYGIDQVVLTAALLIIVVAFPTTSNIILSREDGYGIGTKAARYNSFVVPSLFGAVAWAALFALSIFFLLSGESEFLYFNF